MPTQGPYIKLCSFGARSFSILNAKTGEQVGWEMHEGKGLDEGLGLA